MKIISGDYRGRNIVFRSNQKTRPTSQLVKESVFNILQLEVCCSSFLDLFFGSGQIGIEALSRGATHVTFVDNSVYCRRCLADNLNNLKFDSERFEIVLMNVDLYLSKTKKIFDIVFLDPPYCLGISNKVLENISDHLHHGSTVVVETEKNEGLNRNYKNIEKAKEYFYGKKKITVYKCSKL